MPTRPQRLFFESDNFITVFSGGNRSGKTTAGAVKFIRYLWENPGSTGRVASNKELVHEVLIPTLRFWFGDRLKEVETKKAGRTFDSKWFLPNGSRFDVLTYDQKDIAFAGVELNILWMDEPPPKSKYTESVARFSKGGRILFTFTPLIHAAWVYDEIICGDDEDVVTIYSDIEDNCIECAGEHGEIGYLHHEDIQRILSKYDAEELEARKKGKFIHLAGLIYKGFDLNVHVIDRFVIPPHWTIGQSVDPHDNKPFATNWFAVNEINDVYIIDEHPREPFEMFGSNPWTLEEYLNSYKRKETTEKWNVLRRTMDPNFGNVKSNRTGKSIRQEARAKGFHYVEVDDNLEAGHSKVRQYLHYNKDKDIDGVNKPKLYVLSDCLNTIKSFTHYIYDPETGKPQDEYSHFMDCVRYFLMTNPKYIEKREKDKVEGWRDRMAKKRRASKRERIDI